MTNDSTETSDQQDAGTATKTPIPLADRLRLTRRKETTELQKPVIHDWASI